MATSILEELSTRLHAEDGQVRKSAIASAVSQLADLPTLCESEISSACDFFVSKLDDWASVGGACDGILFLLRKYGDSATSLPAITEPANLDNDLVHTLDLSNPLHASTCLAESVLKRLLLSVHAPSFAQPVRLSVLAIIQELILLTRANRSLQEAIAHGIFLNTEDEKDPRNLPLTFRLLGLALDLQSNNRTREMIIDSVLGYFPIQFASRAVDPGPVKELKEALNLLLPKCGQQGLRAVLRELSACTSDCAGALPGWPVLAWADEVVAYAVTEASTGEETLLVLPLIASVLESLENACDRYLFFADWPRAKLVIAAVPLLSTAALARVVEAALESADFLTSLLCTRPLPGDFPEALAASALSAVLAKRSTGWILAAAHCVPAAADVEAAAQAAVSVHGAAPLKLAILRYQPKIGLAVFNTEELRDDCRVGVISALVKIDELKDARNLLSVALDPSAVADFLEAGNSKFFLQLLEIPTFLTKPGARNFLEKLISLTDEKEEISRSVISIILADPESANLFSCLRKSVSADSVSLETWKFLLPLLRNDVESFSVAARVCPLELLTSEVFASLPKFSWSSALLEISRRDAELAHAIAASTATADLVESLKHDALILRLAETAETEKFLACVSAIGVSRALKQFGVEKVRRAALSDVGVQGIKVLGALLTLGEGELHADLTAIVAQTLRRLRQKFPVLETFALLQLLALLPRVLPLHAVLGFKNEAMAVARSYANHGSRCVRRQAADAQLAWFTLDQLDSDAPSNEGD